MAITINNETVHPRIRKMQTAAGGPIGYKWTRVKRKNGYGYVRTNQKNEAVDYDYNTGRFRVHERPDASSPSFMSEFRNSSLSPKINPNYVYNPGVQLDEVVATAKRPEGAPVQQEESQEDEPLVGVQRERDDAFARQSRTQAIDDYVNRNHGAVADLFGNLLSAGMVHETSEGADDIRNGNYLRGTVKMASPLLFMSGPVGTGTRFVTGLYNLASEDGLQKTGELMDQGRYGRAALSGLGDALNLGMTMETPFKGLSYLSKLDREKELANQAYWNYATDSRGAGLLKSTAGQYKVGQAATQAFNNGTWDYIVGATSPNAGLRTTLAESPWVPRTAFWQMPRGAQISVAERAGIPKGNRNQPFKPKQPTEHIQGEEAVKMFKEYGGTPIPEGSINGEQLRKYVAEARERYGLVGNNNVTDEEIAQALYKHSKELGGNTAAVNAQGEPQLLFRGDTRRYTQLKERISPEELAKKSGTMDNSLGNLFLGEFPDSWRGVDRYIGTWHNFNGSPKLVGSGTGSKVVWDGKTASEIEGYPYLGPQAGGGYKLYSQPHRYGNIDVYKLPASMMESGVNDLNAFIVRTPQMRNASSEISVLNDDWMLQGAKDSHFMSKNYKYNPKTYSMENVKTGESLGEITTESAPESRAAMGDHYKELLKEAEQKQQGLLKSEANAPLRDEHSQYSYFALPNFNIQGAKHLLPYDLRIPRNWKDKNIYRSLLLPFLGLGAAGTLYGNQK